MKPSEEEVVAKADETREALEALLQGKTGLEQGPHELVLCHGHDLEAGWIVCRVKRVAPSLQQLVIV